jgi:hypothetical protein
MGTEESIFSIMCYKHADLVDYFEIESNGLFGKFFEDLKNDTLEIKSENEVINNTPLDISKVGLYVIGFNSPNQFETFVKSMLDYDANGLRCWKEKFKQPMNEFLRAYLTNRDDDGI